ncbi:MAG: hypothetical protein ACRYFS_18550 [Janthinobacterium lividum]
MNTALDVTMRRNQGKIVVEVVGKVDLEPVMHFVGLFGLICPWRG